MRTLLGEFVLKQPMAGGSGDLFEVGPMGAEPSANDRGGKFLHRRRPEVDQL